MKIEAWINDEAEEHLMNLVAQEYYGEAWEFITIITDAFHKGLYIIAGKVILAGEQNERIKHKDNR